MTTQNDMRIVERSSGYWIVASYGVVEGPYITQEEAEEAMMNIS